MSLLKSFPRVQMAPNLPVQNLSTRYTGVELDFQCLDSSHKEICTVSAGKGDHPGPMQLLLYAVANCAMADIVIILKKQRVSLLADALKCEISAQRAEDGGARPFDKIHLEFSLPAATENVTQAKFDRCIELSVEKYCGVHATLHGGPATITYEGKLLS